MTAAHPLRVDPARDAGYARDVLPLLPEVARFARALTRDPADADDLAQETMLAAFRGYHTFRPGSDARRWLLTICRNTFRRQRARDARVVHTAAGEEEELDALAAVMDHVAVRRRGEDVLLDRLDVRPAIAAALAELADPFRVAVVLVDVEGQSYEAAAAIEGVPVGTIRSRLFRGRRVLQQKLFTHARDLGVVRDAPREDGA